MKTLLNPKIKSPDIQLPPEHELIICCARLQAEAHTVERIKSLVRQDLDWQSVIRLAQQQGVMPLLYVNLQKICAASVPINVLQSLEQLFSTNRFSSLLLTSELIKIFTLLEKQAIAVVPYKGPVLAAAVYGDVSLRQYCDLDLVLQQENILPVKQLLIEQGYEPKDSMTEAEELAFLQSKTEHNYTLVHYGKKIIVELHWRITPRFTSLIEPKHFWQNLKPASLAGANFLNLSLEDWLPILCVHGSRHRWERLTWLCDIAEIMRLRPDLDWDAVIARSQVLVCRRMLYLGILLAHDLLDAPLPEQVLRKMQADREVMLLVNSTYQQLLYKMNVSDQFLGKTIYQIRVSDRLQEKALYLQSFLQWLVNPDKGIMHH
ncbi:MAG: nucleotidyltransferase family protein [Cyanobacteria bacterium CAN_BIN43]|nr:nucleotidyltransferase family protein [Cyanobacteria bacterium CAN_BIN43]